jgi:hypothetical protein
MINGKSQNQFVLDHLIDHGYITDTVARNYGIRRLAARIRDLADEGISVLRVSKTDDVGGRYVEYQLGVTARESERRARERGRTYKLASYHSKVAA